MLELLAPAGNFDRLKTALYFGADAVYLAYKDYGLRAFADNFDAEDAVVETVRKYAKHYRIKSRNLAENSLDLVLELRTDEGGKLVREVMGLAGVTSASLLAHDGEVTF